MIVPRLTYDILSSAVDCRMPYRRTPDRQQDWTFALRSFNPGGIVHPATRDETGLARSSTSRTSCRYCRRRARPRFSQARDRPGSIARAHGSEQALQHDKVGSTGDFSATCSRPRSARCSGRSKASGLPTPSDRHTPSGPHRPRLRWRHRSWSGRRRGAGCGGASRNPRSTSNASSRGAGITRSSSPATDTEALPRALAQPSADKGKAWFRASAARRDGRRTAEKSRLPCIRFQSFICSSLDSTLGLLSKVLKSLP